MCYNRLIFVPSGSKPRSRTFLSTSGGSRPSVVILLNPKCTVLWFNVCVFGFSFHIGPPLCPFMILVLSISAEKVIRWKCLCFCLHKGVGAHHWTTNLFWRVQIVVTIFMLQKNLIIQIRHNLLLSLLLEITSATINGSASDLRHRTITKWDVSTAAREGKFYRLPAALPVL